MKRTLFILLFNVLCGTWLFSQYNFVVQNQDMAVYSTLTDAYNAASAGDTIYLPGGSFNLPIIDKPLVWIGVGYHPDSCEATYFTRINNGAAFTGNCDSTSLSGIYFASNVSIGSTSNPAYDFKISRCWIEGALTLKSNDGTSAAINSIIRESVIIAALNANKGSNILVENCVIRNVASNFIGSVFDQNIFTLGYRSSSYGYSYCFSYTSNCLIKNNIINYMSYSNWKIDINDNTNNNMLNNVLIGTTTFPQGTNTGEDNLTGVDVSTLFEHLEGALSDNFLLHDLHLAEGSPAIGSGLGGVDMGIYGGSIPFKEGGLPENPHVQLINIGVETSNGQLPVEIHVTAQDK